MVSCTATSRGAFSHFTHGDSKVKFKQQILLKDLQNSASTQFTLLKCTHYGIICLISLAVLILCAFTIIILGNQGSLFIFGGWRENILPFINPLHALAVTLSGALLIHLAFRFPYPRWQRAGTAAGIPEKRAFRSAFNGNPAAICWRSVRLSVCTRPGQLRSRPNPPPKHGQPTI